MIINRSFCILFYSLLSCILSSSPILGNDKVEALLVKAVKHDNAGKTNKANKAYGLTLKLSQQLSDLMAEQKVTDRLLEVINRGDSRKPMAAFMKAMNSKKSGAFMSAHLLAVELLLDDTRRGETAHAKSATAILKKFAKRKDSGKSAKACLDYGKGMLSLAKKNWVAADKALSKALAAMIQEGWIDHAVYVSSELCALRLAQGDDEGATQVLQQIGSLFQANTDPQLFFLWKTLVDSRLTAASAAVLAPFQAGIARRPNSGLIPGGVGGAGAAGGVAGWSRIGQSFQKLGKNTPLVTVTRQATGFVIQEGFNKNYRKLQSFSPGIFFHVNSGVTLEFFGRSVALRKISLKTGVGGEAGKSSTTLGRAYYHLAAGETLTLTKAGISIR